MKLLIRSKNWFIYLIVIGVLSGAPFRGNGKTSLEQTQSEMQLTKQEGSGSNSFLALVDDPAYVEALKKSFNGKKLREDYMAQMQDLAKGGPLHTHLLFTFKGGEVLAVIESRATSTLKGYIRYNPKTRACVINAGPDYGTAQLTLSLKRCEDIGNCLNKLKEFYQLNDDSEAAFEYETVATYQSGKEDCDEEGSYKVTQNGQTSSIRYDRKDKKIRAAADTYWPLFQHIVDQTIEEVPADTKAAKIEGYEKAIKDLQPLKGGDFTLYQRKQDILMEVPVADLDKIWMAQAAVHSSGAELPLTPGFIIPSLSASDISAVQAYKWHRREDSLCLVSPNAKYLYSEELRGPASHAFTEPVVASYPIEQEHPDKGLILVNVTSFFKGSAHELDRLVDEAMGPGYSLDVSRCMVDNLRVDPDAATVRMSLHYTKMGLGPMGGRSPFPGLEDLFGPKPNRNTDSRSFPIKITYTLWHRTPNSYRPRLADSRVGSIAQIHTDLNRTYKFHSDVNYITRFHLEKKDPKATLSEPVKPIVYTLYNIPKEYKEAVTKGILMWNKAFERIGFKNAVVVQDAPNDPNWDHTDARYNVVRWSIEGFPGAYTMVRMDPFTGQTLNITMNLSTSMFKYITGVYDAHVRPLDGSVESFRKALQSYRFGRESDSKNGECVHSPFRKIFGCQHAKGLSELGAQAWSILKTHPNLPKASKSTFLNQMVTEIVAHEVGHSLGLEHNFIAQTHLTLDQLGDDKLVEKEGLASSVMAYLPPNPKALERGSGYFFTPTIGKYDYWAIEYGYKPIDAASPRGEKPELSKIASRSGESGLAYMHDNDLYSCNPYVAQHVIGKDPIKYVEFSNALAKRAQSFVLKDFTKWGKSHDKQTQRLYGLMLLPYKNAFTALRFIGGIETSRSLPGDTGAKPSMRPIDPATQRRALDLIIKDCLSVESVNLPEKVLHNLSMGYNSHYNPHWKASLRETIHNNQSFLLFALMDPSITQGVIENEFKVSDPKRAYRTTDHYRKLVDAVFSELLNGAKDISPLRRDLQRFCVRVLVSNSYSAGTWFFSADSEVRLICKDELNRVGSLIRARLAKSAGLERLSVLHLRDLQETIEKMQKRNVTETIFD